MTLTYIIKTLLVLTLLLSFSYTQVSAETDLPDIMVMTTDVGTVTLTEKACSFPVLLNMPYEIIATENGNSHTGCWDTVLGDTHIYVAFPDDVQNQVIPMPKKWFIGVDVEAL